MSWVRRAAIMLACACALAIVYLTMPAAQAQSNDEVDDLKINYRIDTDGVLHVTETWDWRFGDDSGRHGIQRELITREPDADNRGKDIVYSISGFTASSPDGVATDVEEIRNGEATDRNRSTTYRIGDPDETVEADTATYVLEYEVRGALRSFADYDEFYWDATGDGETSRPMIDKLAITADVPDGAQDVRCYAGPAGSSHPCEQADIEDGTAVFAASDLAEGDGVTVGVKIKPGLILDNEPHLVRKAGILSEFLDAGLLAPTVVILVISIAIPIVGVVLINVKLADRRYLDLAPGTVPADGDQARIGRDNRPKIPVRFTPPPISVAEAGLLISGQVEAKATTATLVDLAVRGSIRLEQRGSALGVQRVAPVERAAPHEASLFHQLVKGGRRSTLRKHSLAAGHSQVTHIVRGIAETNRWFTQVPAPRKLSGLAYILAPAAIVGAGLGVTGFERDLPLLLIMLVPLLTLCLTGALVMRRVGHGQRDAEGRAVLDQVEGFRKYLKTAEADKLRFEEGQDIFSAYLPWAIVFGLTRRWQRVGRELVDAGRLPDQAPPWYGGGDGRFASLNLGMITSAAGSAARPAYSGSSGGSGNSGRGFGSSGSSFSGGGGASGGGGGGGGASSW